jgi:sulfate transport system ATP-binding protein
MQISAPGWGGLEGTVRRVRTFGPIQRADIVVPGRLGETVIEIDAPRDRELHSGDIVGLQPRRYRIFADQP